MTLRRARRPGESSWRRRSPSSTPRSASFLSHTGPRSWTAGNRWKCSVRRRCGRRRPGWNPAGSVWSATIAAIGAGRRQQHAAGAVDRRPQGVHQRRFDGEGVDHEYRAAQAGHPHRQAEAGAENPELARQQQLLTSFEESLKAKEEELTQEFETQVADRTASTTKQRMAALKAELDQISLYETNLREALKSQETTTREVGKASVNLQDVQFSPGHEPAASRSDPAPDQRHRDGDAAGAADSAGRASRKSPASKTSGPSIRLWWFSWRSAAVSAWRSCGTGWTRPCSRPTMSPGSLTCPSSAPRRVPARSKRPCSPSTWPATTRRFGRTCLC